MNANKGNRSFYFVSCLFFVPRMETLTEANPPVTLRSWRTVMGSQRTASASHTLTENPWSPLRWWVTRSPPPGKHFHPAILLQAGVLLFYVYSRFCHLLPSFISLKCPVDYLMLAAAVLRAWFYSAIPPVSQPAPALPLTSHLTRELHKGPAEEEHAHLLRFYLCSSWLEWQQANSLSLTSIFVNARLGDTFVHLQGLVL